MQRIAACVWVLGTLVGSVLAEPVLEYAPAPDGPWTAVADTFLAERADGGWGLGAVAEDAARFYRVVDPEGVGFCVTAIHAASRVRFLPQSLDSDGDTVPDCADACPGQDDRKRPDRHPPRPANAAASTKAGAPDAAGVRGWLGVQVRPRSGRRRL